MFIEREVESMPQLPKTPSFISWRKLLMNRPKVSLGGWMAPSVLLFRELLSTTLHYWWDNGWILKTSVHIKWWVIMMIDRGWWLQTATSVTQSHQWRLHLLRVLIDFWFDTLSLILSFNTSLQSSRLTILRTTIEDNKRLQLIHFGRRFPVKHFI